MPNYASQTNRRKPRGPHHPHRRRNPNDGAKPRPTPFKDRKDYLSCLGRAVAERFAAAGLVPEQDEDEVFVPLQRRGHRRGRGRRGPSGRPWHLGPGMHPHGPGGRPPEAFDDDGPGPGSDADAVAELKARVRATSRARGRFVWPHVELASAVGMSRPAAAVAVVVCCALRTGCWPDDADPGAVAEVTAALMGVDPRHRGAMATALKPGGELFCSGLFREPGSGHPYFDPFSGAPLTDAARRFVEGRPTRLASRVVVPGGTSVEDVLGRRTAVRLAARCARRKDLRDRLGSASRPLAGAIRRLGPLELGLPPGVEVDDLPRALATLLGCSVIDGRTRPGEHASPSRPELAAEACLRRAVVLVDGPPDEDPSKGGGGPFGAMFGLDEEVAVAWPSELTVLSLRRVDRGWTPSPGILMVEPPDEDERRELWRSSCAAIGVEPPASERLAVLATIPLHAETIASLAVRTSASCDQREEVGAELLRAAREIGVPESGRDAMPTTRLRDVILSPAIAEQAAQALDACRDGAAILKSLAGTAHDAYGHSPVLLFSGPPGTGKTYLAEALAGELGRPLRRLSGPDLRSCWYGEAEKQIRTEFRRKDDAVLFLDEIDGFLKQRGSGPTSQTDDRLANVLLEEIERTEHVVVMGTNLAGALDAALSRRVLFHLRFEAPGPVEREALWKLHLPDAVEGAADVDVSRLAKLTLTGGEIKNASFRAILRASRDKVALSTGLVLEEASREASGGGGRKAVGFGG